MPNSFPKCGLYQLITSLLLASSSYESSKCFFSTFLPSIVLLVFSFFFCFSRLVLAAARWAWKSRCLTWPLLTRLRGGAWFFHHVWSRLVTVWKFSILLGSISWLLARESSISWAYVLSAPVMRLGIPWLLCYPSPVRELNGITDQCLVLRFFAVSLLFSFTHGSLRSAYTYLENPFFFPPSHSLIGQREVSAVLLLGREAI